MRCLLSVCLLFLPGTRVDFDSWRPASAAARPADCASGRPPSRKMPGWRQPAAGAWRDAATGRTDATLGIRRGAQHSPCRENARRPLLAIRPRRVARFVRLSGRLSTTQPKSDPSFRSCLEHGQGLEPFRRVRVRRTRMGSAALVPGGLAETLDPRPGTGASRPALHWGSKTEAHSSSLPASARPEAAHGEIAAMSTHAGPPGRSTGKRFRNLLRGAGSTLVLYPDPPMREELLPKGTLEQRLSETWTRVGGYLRNSMGVVEREARQKKKQKQ